MLRDEAFDKKWQLYKMDLADEKHYAIWQEFLLSTEHTPFPKIYYQLSRTPIWLEKRFGIQNKRVSHASITFGHDYLTETTLDKPHIAANPPLLTKEKLKVELEAWTPRNLNIFFLEFVIDNEIAVLENQVNSEISSLISDEAMQQSKRLEHYYKNLLRVVNDAHFECFEATAIHTVNTAHVSQYSPDAEFESFKFRYLHYLQQLSTVEEFYKLKARLASGNLYSNDHYGLIHLDADLPNTNPTPSISTALATKTTQPTPTTIPARHARTIIIPIAIGTLLGLLAIGIAAAIIFTGGAATLLGTAIIAGILVTSGITPIIAAILTRVSLPKSENKQAMSTAFIQSQLGNTSADKDCIANNTTAIKSQPPQGEPFFQNPSPLPAPTRSVTLR